MSRQLDYFDIEERERGRQALFKYMTRQGIKMPTLHKRINTFLDRNGVSEKTLQRFLNRQIKKTNDTSISNIMRFADQCNMADVMREAGRGLSAFYEAKRRQDFSGLYVGLLLDGKLTVHIREGDGYWRICARREGKSHEILQGVMVDIGGGGLAMLKDMLTQLPASYIFLKTKDQLVGTGYAVPPRKTLPGHIAPSPAPENDSVVLSRVKPDGH